MTKKGHSDTVRLASLPTWYTYQSQ